MELHEAQAAVKTLLAKIEHPRLGSYIALSEEVGEVANEIMQLEIYDEQTSTEKLEGEIADTLVALLELASVYNIDISQAFESKLANLKTRVPKWEGELGPKLARKREKLN